MGSPKIGIAVASRVIFEAKVWLRPATIAGVSRSGSRVGLGAFSCGLVVAPCSFFPLLRRGVSRLWGHSCCLGYGPNGFGFLPGMSPVGFGVLFLFPSPPTSTPPTSTPPTSFPHLLPSPSPVSFAASHFLPLFPRLAGSVASWGHSCCLGCGPKLFGVLPGMSPVGVFLLFSFLLPPTLLLAAFVFRRRGWGG